MSPAERESLILAHRHIAEAMGFKAAWVPLDPPDRAQEAVIALIRAVDAWEPSRCPLVPWVVLKIRRHLLDLRRRWRRPYRAALRGSGDPDLDLALRMLEDPRPGEPDVGSGRYDLAWALGCLDPDQADLVARYFGLNSAAPQSSRQLGPSHGYSGRSSAARVVRRGVKRLRALLRDRGSIRG
jgi:hypothetical protein